MVKTNNQKYVQRGRGIVPRHDPDWEKDLKKVNHRKNGAPYRYSDSQIMVMVAMRFALTIPFRQLQGMIQVILGIENTPHFSTIQKRMKKLKVNMNNGIIFVVKGSIIMAVDATGLKKHNGGEWIHHKWKTKRGFAKLHLLIDVKTRRILAAEITDESVGDITMLPKLLGQIINQPVPKKIGRKNNTLAKGLSPLANISNIQNNHLIFDAALFGDGAYGSRDMIKMCNDMGIEPLIRIKRNSTTRGKGTGDEWGCSVRDQLGGSPDVKSIADISVEEIKENIEYWKARVEYGQRWIVEVVISAFKRIFGESVMSRTTTNIIQEIKIKISIWNRWIDAGHVQ